MEKLTQKIINYTNSKYTYNYKKWNIGFTDDIKEIKKNLKIKMKLFVSILNLGPAKQNTGKTNIKRTFPFRP